MPPTIKPTVEIKWSTGASILLNHTSQRPLAVPGFFSAARAVPIGQVWVSMPEGAVRNIEGNANVYLAGEVIGLDSFLFSHHSLAKFAENPGSLVISAQCDLPGIDIIQAQHRLATVCFCANRLNS